MIPVNEPLLDGNEKKYLCECVDTGWVGSEGPFVARLEADLAAMAGRRHAVAVSSGTAALEVAAAALGIGPGDSVVMPAGTIISCAAAAVRAGAVPVLMDSDPLTWNMDTSVLAERVEAEIRRGVRIKAVMAVHTYGLPADMDPVLDVAHRHGLKVIEDAAQMHGQKYHGRPCGSFGDISIFSFYPNKHVTTGEGGMVVTDDDALADKCRSLRNLCFQPGKRFVHEELGWNFRMSNVQAALGVAQMERLDVFVARKRAMGAYYTKLLRGTPGVALPLASTGYAENIYWVYGVVLDDDCPADAGEVMRLLSERGIGTRPFFYPMHEQPVFRRMGLFSGEIYPVAERLARRGFYIPSGLALTRAQMDEAAGAVRDVMSGLMAGKR